MAIDFTGKELSSAGATTRIQKHQRRRHEIIGGT